VASLARQAHQPIVRNDTSRKTGSDGDALSIAQHAGCEQDHDVFRQLIRHHTISARCAVCVRKPVDEFPSGFGHRFQISSDAFRACAVPGADLVAVWRGGHAGFSGQPCRAAVWAVLIHHFCEHASMAWSPTGSVAVTNDAGLRQVGEGCALGANVEECRHHPSIVGGNYDTPRFFDMHDFLGNGPVPRNDVIGPQAALIRTRRAP